ncbi:MAG: hypothetical protein NVS3B2_16830 [Ramlibacter sp.]
MLRPGHAAVATIMKARQDQVKATIAACSDPRAIDFVSSLPRTETGTLQRLRRRESA